MNAFLVIAGSIIVGLLIALWAIKQFKVQTRVFGIPLKYVLGITLLVVAVIVVIVVRTALGNKNKQLEALLLKLRILQVKNKTDIIDEHIQQNNTTIAEIDQQISQIQGSSNQSKIDSLIKQKQDIEKKTQEFNQQKQTHADNKASLEDRVKAMQNQLNG